MIMKRNLITLSILLALSACSDSDKTEDSVPTNVAAVISGDIVGDAIEDTDVVTTGQLTVVDPDTGEAAFVAQTGVTSTYGTFSIDTTGGWGYILDHTLQAVQDLGADELLTDTFTVTTIDTTAQVVTITIRGIDEPPTLSACTGTSSLTILSATDDGTYDDVNEPSLTIDGDTNSDSRWSTLYTDTGKAITFDLGEQSKIKQLELLWLKADQRTTYYEIEASVDNTTWVSVLANGESSIITDDSFETIDVTESEAQYVRLTGLGNSSSGWVSLIEANVLGCQLGDIDDGGGDDGGGDDGGGDDGGGDDGGGDDGGGDDGGGDDNTAAVITGDLAETTINTFDDDFEGTIYINDEDGDDEEKAVAQTDVATTYGTFSINEDGEWIYLLNTSDSDVAALASANDTLTDTIAIESVDGTTQNIVITITGVDLVDIDPTPVSGEDTVPTVNCTTTVSSLSALEDGVDDLNPGDTLCLADGTYTGDLELRIEAIATADSPITVAAENPGKAIITDGQVSVNMGGEYIVLQGFVFRDGESGSSIIKFEKETNCNYCRVTEVAIIDMDGGDYSSSKWIEYEGHHNRIDHSWFSGKESKGALLVLGRWTSESDFAANGFITDYAQIDHNYFGNRPPAFGKAYAGSSDNEYEGVRLGLSTTHSAPSYSIVENNYFERIQGEAEVISNKSANNTIRNNTVRNSNGSIVTRHGAAATISNNYVFGDDNPFSGGIRLVDGDHTVTNNYVEGARYSTSNWNGGIVLTTGDDSGDGENGYQNVENVLIANNTIVDSVNSINVYGGNNSVAPESIFFVNNIVADAIGAVIRTNGEDMPSNSTFAGNYIYGQEFSDNDDVTELSTTGFSFVDAMLEKGSDGLYRPSASSPALTASDVDTGDFDLPSIDMDGQDREDITQSGADEVSTDDVTLAPLTSADVGPSYRPAAGQVYVEKVTIVNHDFDTGDLTGWTDNSGTGAAITTGDDSFSRGSSLVLDSNSADVSQTVAVVENTNYTLSAFLKGSAQLSVTIDGQTYAAERSSDSYGFSSVSFNSGSGTSAVITASVDDFVTNKATIENANFDDGQDDWEVVEGTGIGQVQDSDNSSDSESSEGSIKFKWNVGDDTGTPHQPYIAQTIDVETNTDYELSMYNLMKTTGDSTVRFGAFAEDSDTNITAATIIAEKDSDYATLVSDGATEGADDFFKDTMTINTGSYSTITVFAQFNSTDGAEIRIDQFELSYQGAPADGTEAFFDSIRLVSHPLSEAESIAAEDD